MFYYLKELNAPYFTKHKKDNKEGSQNDQSTSSQNNQQ